MDQDRELKIAPGDSNTGNRVLIECALEAAGDSAVRNENFTLCGDELEAFYHTVRERCSQPPLSDTDLGHWLAEHVDWWVEDSVAAIVFHAREDGSGIISPIIETGGEVPTSFAEPATRSSNAGWIPSDLPAADTRLP